MEKMLQIHLKGSGVNESEIESVLRMQEHEKNIKSAISKKRTAVMVYRFLDGIGGAAVWAGLSAVFLLLAGPVGLIIVFLFGLAFVHKVLDGIRYAFRSLGRRVAPILRDTPENVAIGFYEELDWDIPDWGKMYDILAPFAARKTSLIRFVEGWKQLKGRRSEKGSSTTLLHDVEETVRGSMGLLKRRELCSSCGIESSAYRTAFPWKFKQVQPPFSLMECPNCGAIYCKNCLKRHDKEVCTKCKRKIGNNPSFYFYEDKPLVQITRMYISPTYMLGSHVKAHKSTVEEIRDVGFYWDCVCLYDAPQDWYEYGKPQGEAPSEENIFKGQVHLDNASVKIGSKWYLLQPTPGTTAEVRWD